MIEVKKLKIGMSPRVGEQDFDHARLLAQALDHCPPVLVEPNSLTIVDGVHRVLAARLLGRNLIRVTFFDGSHEEAQIEAIRANVAHGKPLSLPERELAAKKLLIIRDDWSNRLIGDYCGLSDKTVGRIRSATAEIPQSPTRIGKDGKRRTYRDLRSINSSKIVGSSVGGSAMTNRSGPRRPENSVSTNGDDSRSRITTLKSPDSTRSNNHWCEDAAITSIEGGLELATWLEDTAISHSDWHNWPDRIPVGRIPDILEAAYFRARQWNEFAKALEERARRSSKRQGDGRG